MIILGYVGNHAQDSLAVRLGWAATRLVQRGQFARVTHVEGTTGPTPRGKRISLEDALDALDETATAEDVAGIIWQ